MSQFAQPGISNPEDKFAPSENAGALLLFFPTAFTAQVKTAHGESDAVTARIVRLNDGRVYDNAMVFSTALVTQLKGAIADQGMVLGTLGQGENTKGNPPWLLSPHTEADVAVAERWLAANPRNQFQQAPPTTPVSVASGTPVWGQQAAPAPSAAPATAGWGSPAPSAAPAWGATQAAAPVADYNVWQNTPTAPAPAADWAAAAAHPAPPVSAVDPGLVEALRKKGVNVPPGTSQQDAEGVWAVVGSRPDTVA